ncbi:DUF2267 domain-containing protein [Streptomyces roseirectus]|uniref:DUF2267 domain-containing protein n=1 Tax=Streptomyces roseirectus TaxID=2768066 RepID=A0A7H0II62_9ACTN|nr:DUF2267 domain-containing protein [Streptomyces roseirectus]QNP72478.1 DUF2267 domain-containing protein [Streptomyces roseirectus]
MTTPKPHATTPKPTVSTPSTTGTKIPAPRHSLVRTPESWPRFIARVRSTGQYPTEAEAERVTRTTLKTLSPHLPAPDRTSLTRTLPPEAAHLLTAHPYDPNSPVRATEFVDKVAARLNNTPPDKARWHVTSVLTVLSHFAGPTTTNHLIAQLPQGYALLFGKAELTRNG